MKKMLSSPLCGIVLLLFLGAFISTLFKSVFGGMFTMKNATDLMLKVAGAKEIIDIITHNNKNGIGSDRND